MKSTFAFCLQLPTNELPVVFNMMNTWLKYNHRQSVLKIKALSDTICEYGVVGSKKSISAFKKWIKEAPTPDNAISHYIVENPNRKNYDDVYLQMQLSRESHENAV